MYQIVVLDDEKGPRDTVRSILSDVVLIGEREERYEVVEYDSIQKAREGYRPGQTALVISDNACPDKNAGYTWLMELRGADEKMGLILMTGGKSTITDTEKIRRMRYGHGIGFCEKPFEDVFKLAEIIKERLSIYESNRSLIPETSEQPESPSS